MYQANQLSGLTAVFQSFNLGGLSGAATTHSHTASLQFAVNGAFGTAPTGTTTPTVNSSRQDVGSVNGTAPAGAPLSVAAPASGFRGALVVWTIDAAGTKRIRSKGFFDSLAGNALTLEFPDVPPTEVVVAYHTVRIGTNLSGTFTYGTSNWNTTGVTVGAVVNTTATPGPGAVQIAS